MMAYRTDFSHRLMPVLVILGVGGLIFDFHYGGEVVLDKLGFILLTIGQAALTGWLAIGFLSFVIVKRAFFRRRP